MGKRKSGTKNEPAYMEIRFGDDGGDAIAVIRYLFGTSHEKHKSVISAPAFVAGLKTEFVMAINKWKDRERRKIMREIGKYLKREMGRVK